MVEGIIYLF